MSDGFDGSCFGDFSSNNRAMVIFLLTKGCAQRGRQGDTGEHKGHEKVGRDGSNPSYNWFNTRIIIAHRSQRMRPGAGGSPGSLNRMAVRDFSGSQAVLLYNNHTGFFLLPLITQKLTVNKQ
jgi:hypothetical protein